MKNEKKGSAAVLGFLGLEISLDAMAFDYAKPGAAAAINKALDAFAESMFAVGHFQGVAVRVAGKNDERSRLEGTAFVREMRQSPSVRHRHAAACDCPARDEKNETEKAVEGLIHNALGKDVQAFRVMDTGKNGEKLGLIAARLAGEENTGS